MKDFSFQDVTFEINQTRKSLLDYFEMVVPSAEWPKARKKILDAFSPEDGLAFRIGKTLGQTKGKDTNGTHGNGTS